MQSGHKQPTKQRMYRRVNPNGGSAWATREIAALDFLLGIPLEKEQEIVLNGLAGDKHVGRDMNDSEEEKVKIVPPTRRDLVSTNTIRTGNVLLSSNAMGGRWLESIMRKDSRNVLALFKDAEEKRRSQLELETDVLERPSDLEASSKDESIIVPTNVHGSSSAPNSDFPNQKTVSRTSTGANLNASNHAHGALTYNIPGRRLDGHEPVVVCIPREAEGTEQKTRYRTVARKAVEREWELQMTKFNKRKGLLDGRIFFSSQFSYPVGVFSVIKYDPKNEEEFRRRQKLEAQGGGGAQFIIPTRDWRGVSYRELLARREPKNKVFNRMLKRRRKRAMRKYERAQKMKDREKGTDLVDFDTFYEWPSSGSDDELKFINSRSPTHSLTFPDHRHRSNSYSSHRMGLDESDDEVTYPLKSYSQGSNRDNDIISSSSSDESTTYTPGFLDDPDMVQGKHRTMLMGDTATGCIASSIIHYVQPADLKADLNKQFRQRFDQWEPPKSQRKYIGAAIVDGAYKLMDKTEPIVEVSDDDERGSNDEGRRRKRKNSSSRDLENLHMPPSLTLSKIRKLKRSALLACVNAKIEVSTMALACVYFERLALDCRVDKSNRRLTFATCLLIAIKINESNVKIVHEESSKESKRGVLKSWIKPRQDYDFFSSLFTFFTHEWGLSLKQIFAAEWGTFSALGFRLHASPSDVSFHFKRLMKALEWSPLDYLGQEMYDYWQDAVATEQIMKEKRGHRKARRKKRKEKQILRLQRELEQMEKNRHSDEIPDKIEVEPISDVPSHDSLPRSQKRIPGIGLFSRISYKTRRGPNDFQSISTSVSDDRPDSIPEKTIKRSLSSPNLSNSQLDLDRNWSHHDTIEEEISEENHHPE